MRVEVYYNLHKHCLSVRYRGKVIQHTNSIELVDVKFAVQPAGRDKVIKEKKKNVHAFVRGLVTTFTKSQVKNLRAVDVIYNPYKYDSFVNKTDYKPIFNAKCVCIEGKKITAYINI